jgi:ribosomal protein L12E/L44/L45/RPP1/RPP2
LYYIREKIGKGAKIKELIIKKGAKSAAAAPALAASTVQAAGAETAQS